MSKEYDIKRNASGYYDPTAYKAIKKVDEENERFHRFHRLLRTIFYICRLAGFEIEGRIVLTDIETGRTWRVTLPVLKEERNILKYKKEV